MHTASGLGNLNPFGYVQLANLKKPKKKDIFSRFTAQRKIAGRFGPHP